MGRKHKIIERCHRVDCGTCQAHYGRYSTPCEYKHNGFAPLYRKIRAAKSDWGRRSMPIGEFRLKLRHQPKRVIVRERQGLKAGSNPTGPVCSTPTVVYKKSVGRKPVSEGAKIVEHWLCNKRKRK